MKIIYENKYYVLQIANNKYYRYDKILNKSVLLSKEDLTQMLININNN